MNVYGISVKKYITRFAPLYNLLLFHAPLYPLELYALAASYDLYDLAVPASSHLLSFPLASLTDEMVDRIGPRYLKRLFFLHFGRSDALRRLLLPPPYSHPPTVTCNFTEQKKMTRAWALASAYFAWDARPDLSTSSMESALAPLAEEVSLAIIPVGTGFHLKVLPFWHNKQAATSASPLLPLHLPKVVAGASGTSKEACHYITCTRFAGLDADLDMQCRIGTSR
ncbi:hypothetical protein EV401DRAFT_1896481 [Pisolithus croceorrhizus]|nr:hypothetical protein EV401DRAFT_1896481 [Pisolithus croceorrhizus]